MAVMKESTRVAVEALRVALQDKEMFRESDVKGVSVSTLLRHGLVERVDRVNKMELSMEDAVELLNQLEGADNWYDHSDGYIYYKVENGKMYQVCVSHGYLRFK